MSVELGKTYTDEISGWKGVASGVHSYLNGCQRVTLSGSLKDGNPGEFVFDVQQLVDEAGRPADEDFVREAQLQVSRLNRLLRRRPPSAEKKAHRTGGPRPTPGRTGL